jgi:hypothetical protein
MKRSGANHAIVVSTAIIMAVVLAGDASAGPVSDADSTREAMLRTYVHGVNDELAAEVLNVDALPVLRDLLADPGFPRRDNVVAFIAHLDSGGSTQALLDFLVDPPAGWSSPEEDRALLLAPVALGYIAAEGDRRALDSLLSMTADLGDGGVLALAASRGADAGSLRADLMEMALRGLAFSGAPAARDRIWDIARGRVAPEAEGRDLTGSALASLELFAEVHEEASPAGAPPASESDPGGSSPGSSNSLNSDPGTPVVQPDAFDTQARAHDNALTYANHVDTPSPMNDSRLDDVFAESNLRAGRSDYSGDLACCITISRLGSAASFGSAGDGLDRIDTSAEINAVLNNSVARVKVVRAINYCGGPGSNIVGCAQTPGDGMAVVRMGSLVDESILWLHEYGHNTGQGHSGDFRHIMFRSLTGSNNGIGENHCSFYHSPLPWANAIVTDTGACTDVDGDEVQDGIDNCPEHSNAGQEDTDADGAGTPCDNCPGESNPDQLDTDENGQGNVCDPDDDGDGVEDFQDCAPLDPGAAELPGRAGGLGWTDKVELAWTSGSQSQVSNVYRGTIAATFQQDWSCLANDVPGTAWSDPENPPSSQGFHYLVTSENVCGESDGGTGTEEPRTFTPCP